VKKHHFIYNFTSKIHYDFAVVQTLIVGFRDCNGSCTVGQKRLQMLKHIALIKC